MSALELLWWLLVVAFGVFTYVVVAVDFRAHPQEPDPEPVEHWDMRIRVRHGVYDWAQGPDL